ncbi:MAG: patatin-like phospholipase family protein [Candidatus Gastranaerophilales bacterium]|nr:patatin-like phospholipase family protein [Candidatus Gastranaerophilales bacterium]
MTNKIPYNCIFGGGGIRGMCYIGAIQALEECGIEIASIGGSSVGAVFAVLYAIGYSADEIKEFFLNFNMHMFRDININIFDSDISLSKGEIFLEWLREKIGKKVLGCNYDKSKKVFFKDIEKDLEILTININTNTPSVFSKNNTPDVEIASAVRASASLPGLMKPMNIANELLVDGDLIKSRPAWKIYDNLNNPNTRLLEFRLEGSRNGEDIKNPVDYINSVISSILYLSTENVFNLYHNNDRYDYIVIDTKDIILFDFNIDRDVKENLIEKGYKVTKEYFLSGILDKKRIILNIYEKLLNKITMLYKTISKQNLNYSINIINEILSSMYEDTKYIDIAIYEKIKNLKAEIKQNTKKQFLFGEKTNKEKQISRQCENIIHTLEERISDIKNYLK